MQEDSTGNMWGSGELHAERVKAVQENNGGHTKKQKNTLGPIWIFSLGGVLAFGASGLDINGCVELFWGDSTFTLLYKLYTDYFTLYQSVIYSVLSHK